MNDTAVSLFRQSKQTKDGQTVQLNKGHFCLDTEERLQEFSQKLASDWNDEYEEYRRLWVELPASRTIRDYPLLLDLELASICNLKCPMCYTITDEFKQKVTKGFMDIDLYQRIVIGSDGKVMMCSNDEDGKVLIGDANEQTIHEIWHGSHLNIIRDRHKDPQGFKTIETCRECYYPRKAKVDENATVNGRTINIENYLQRAQQVGK